MSLQEEINIVYNCDDKYVKYLIPSIQSIIDNTATDVHFHIVNNFQSPEHVQEYFTAKGIKATLYNINKELLESLDVPTEYYRLLRQSVHINLYELIKRGTSNEVDHTAPPGFYFILYPYLFDFDKHIYLFQHHRF